MRAKYFFIFFLLLLLHGSLTCLYAEDVKISTYYPSPYGSYKQVQVQNQDVSSTITDFTQGLLKSGLNIITDYANGSYTPGIFWSTQDDNNTKPKAGIWMYEDSTGSKLLFDTSSRYTTGLHSTPSMVIDKDGNVGIGIASPSQKLSVEGSLGILESGSTPSFHTIIRGGDQSADITYTLPTAQGASNTVLTNSGAGALSWATGEKYPTILTAQGNGIAGGVDNALNETHTFTIPLPVGTWLLQAHVVLVQNATPEVSLRIDGVEVQRKMDSGDDQETGTAFGIRQVQVVGPGNRNVPVTVVATTASGIREVFPVQFMLVATQVG